MNKLYRNKANVMRPSVVWKERLFVVMLSACLAGLTGNAAAAPVGGTVGAGAGVISQSGKTTTVNQSTQNLLLNWQQFGIAADETVRFVQPDSRSVALNRVLGNSPSAIYGSLQANGQVFLVNPNGILFGQSAQVNVGGLLASTLDISNEDFMAGRYSFNGTGPGLVRNEGNLQTAPGGYIVLLGARVENAGLLRTPGGSVVLGAGQRMHLDMTGDGLLNLNVEASALDAGIENQGVIQAGGGLVLMTARAKDAMLDTVINNNGIVEAQSAFSRNGKIILDGGDMGIVAQAGVLDASGKQVGQTGGTVKVLGDKVGLFGKSVIDVSGDAGGGTALIGGNFQGQGPERNASQTFVGREARILANAINSGDGGRVIVWSNKGTRYYGTIEARGGKTGGNGGFVEVSGKEGLDFMGRVIVSAPQGQAGQLLLDPTTINIVAGASGSGTMDALLSLLSPAEYLLPFSLVDNLLGNTLSLGYLQSLGDANITLQATDSIIIGDSGGAAANLDLSSSLLSQTLTLTAGNGTGGSGDVIFNNGSSLTTGGGSVAINAGTVTGLLGNTSGTVTLGAINTGTGDLSVNSLGNVTQSGALDVGGAVNINAGSGNITLTNVANTLNGTISAVGGTVALVNDSVSGTTVGNINTGNLDLTSTGGGIVQSLGTSVVASGPVNLDAGVNPIALTNAGNDLDGVVTLSGGAVSLTDVDNLQLGVSTGLASLSLDLGGSLSQSGQLGVVGNVDITALGDVQLVNSGNDIDGVLSVAGNNVGLVDIDGLTLGVSSVLGNLDATLTGGVLNQTGALDVNGDINLNVGPGDVSLTNVANTLDGTISTVGGTVALVNDSVSGTTVGNTTATNLNVTSSNGAVTQATGSTVALTGNLTVDANTNAVSLANAGNTVGGATQISGGDITLLDSDANGTTLAQVGGTSLDLTSGGAVVQAAGSTVELNGALTVDAGSNDITLDNIANTLDGTISTVGGTVALVNDSVSGTTVGNTTATNLDVSSSNGAVTQATGSTVALTGNLTVDANTNAVSLANAGNTVGGATQISGGDITLLDSDANGTTLAQVGGTSLDLTSGGAVVQAAGSTVVINGDMAIDGATSDITLGNTGNDVTGTVTLNGGNIAFNDTNGVTLGATTAAGNLDVTAGGNIDLPTSGGNGVVAAGDVTLNANGSSANITAGAGGSGVAIESTSGSVNLQAGNNIALGGAGQAVSIKTDQGAGGITLAAGGQVTLDDGAVLSTNTGTVNVTSGGDIALLSSTLGGTGISAQTTGDIQLNAGGDVSLAVGIAGVTTGNIATSTAGGNITVNAVGLNGDSGLLVAASPGVVTLTLSGTTGTGTGTGTGDNAFAAARSVNVQGESSRASRRTSSGFAERENEDEIGIVPVSVLEGGIRQPEQTQTTTESDYQLDPDPYPLE